MFTKNMEAIAIAIAIAILTYSVARYLAIYGNPQPTKLLLYFQPYMVETTVKILAS